MRETEFKGKRKDNDEWIYGNLIQWGDNRYSIMPISMHVELAFANYEVIPETIGQYTGLKDKNGKKIFEGDIVKTNRDVIAKVLWDNDYLGYFLHVNEENSIEDFENGEQPLYDYFEDIEVIGNIYDNPELLKEEL